MTSGQLAQDTDAMEAASAKDAISLVLVHNLLQTQNALGATLDAELRGKKLTATAFNALLLLHRAGPKGLRMGEVGDGLVVTKSNVTGLVDRLGKRGLVERGSGADRRVVTVRLTPAGETILATVLPLYEQAAEDLTACLEEAEKELLIQLLTKLRRELRRERRARRGAKQKPRQETPGREERSAEERP